MTQNKKFLLILGSVICLYITYIRIVLQRIPHKIEFHFSPVLFVFYFLLTICFGYLALKKINLILFKSGASSTSNLNLFIIKMNNIYKNALLAVYDFFIDKERIPIKPLIRACMFKVNDICLYLQPTNLRTFFYIYFGLCLLPRIIVALSLMCDVIIFQEFHYLYCTIWLLLIPLIWNILWYLIKECLNLDYEFISLFLDIEYITNNKILSEKYKSDKPLIKCVRKNHPRILELYPLSDAEYEEMVNDVTKIFRVRDNYVEMYDASGLIYQMKFHHYSLFFIYLISFLSWFYLTLAYGFVLLASLGP